MALGNEDGVVLEVGCWDVQQREGAERLEGSFMKKLLLCREGFVFRATFHVHVFCTDRELCAAAFCAERRRWSDRVLAIPAVRAAIVGVVQRRHWSDRVLACRLCATVFIVKVETC
jgi:hypothetical protein